MTMRRALAIVLVAVVCAQTVPDFKDEQEFDLAFLAEQEALTATPSHMRLNPKVYASAAEARRAAEEELSKLGEEVETPITMKQQAEKEALSLAKNTASDPWHSDMEGVKVDLGNEGVYADKPAVKSQPSTVVAPVETVPIDSQNEQSSSQQTETDIPLAKHTTKKAQHKSMTPSHERIPDGASHLLEDESGVRPVRPSAPQYFPMGFQNMMAPPALTRRNAQAHLRAPDADEDTPLPAPSAQQQPQQPMGNPMQMPFSFNSLFPANVLQQQNQIPFQQLLQNSQAPSNLPLSPNQLPDMMRQMTQLLQSPPQQQHQPQFPFPQFNLKQQQQMPQMSIQQMMASVPSMFPQMQQQIPNMMQQMSQSLVQQMPQLNQQLPQIMQQFPQYLQQQMPAGMANLPFQPFPTMTQASLPKVKSSHAQLEEDDEDDDVKPTRHIALKPVHHHKKF